MDGMHLSRRIGRARRWLRRTVGRPFASLPARIITSVFAAALVSSALVTGISTQSTETFLRGQMNERFPELLEDTTGRLELWYAQRQLDIDTFARSETVLESLQADAAGVAAAEAQKYLSYVKEGFPQYRALFVLDPEGQTRVWVGDELRPPPALRAELTNPGADPVSRIYRGDGAAHQIISAPVISRGRVVGSLHATVAIESISELLAGDGIGTSTRVYVVGPAGEIIARAGEAARRARFDRALPVAGEPAVVGDYRDPTGKHLVGSATRLARFGWSVVVEQSYEVAFAPVVSVIRKILAINFGIVIAFGGIAFFIARSIVRPIQGLSLVARLIAKGETDVVIPASRGHDEIGVLSRALHQMVTRLRRNQVELERKQGEIERANLDLQSANEELRRGNEVLEQLSFTDGLTRLHNHRYFQDRLLMEGKRANRSKEPLALLLLDIDDFKLLNDSHGHAAGDEVLRRVAEIIGDTVRDTDLPARYGGEEFAVLAPNTGADGAMAIAEKLRIAISDTGVHVEGVEEFQVLSVTVSIGVAIHTMDSRTLFNAADRALYGAKAAGKDCVMLAAAPE